MRNKLLQPPQAYAYQYHQFAISPLSEVARKYYVFLPREFVCRIAQHARVAVATILHISLKNHLVDPP